MGWVFALGQWFSMGDWTLEPPQSLVLDFSFFFGYQLCRQYLLAGGVEYLGYAFGVYPFDAASYWDCFHGIFRGDSVNWVFILDSHPIFWHSFTSSLQSAILSSR